VITPAAACLVAAAVSVLGVLFRWLTPAGAAAAAVVGTAVLSGGGWAGAAMLATFFVLGSLLSRWRERRASTPRDDAKAGPRDAVQVLANGLPAAVAAIATPLSLTPIAVVGGALAAAAADTCATEIGTVFGRVPRLITTLRPVPPGTSGAVTPVGILASFGGAAAIALAGQRLGLPAACIPAIVAAGVTGALLDSLAGAILQGRFRCEHCNVDTERRVHRCGRPAAPLRGLPWLTNDGVNLLATAWGGGAVLLWLWLSSP